MNAPSLTNSLLLYCLSSIFYCLCGKLNRTRSGPLTYRTYDGRRKARFLDILSLFNRINNSKLRISELETLRLQQTHERVEYRQVSTTNPCHYCYHTRKKTCAIFDSGYSSTLFYWWSPSTNHCSRQRSSSTIASHLFRPLYPIYLCWRNNFRQHLYFVNMLAIRQSVARSSTLITHKHIPTEENQGNKRKPMHTKSNSLLNLLPAWTLTIPFLLSWLLPSISSPEKNSNVNSN